jgi:acetyl-CoA carboxylase beta subunit
MLEHGMVDMVVARADLRATLARLLGLYTVDNRPDTLAIDREISLQA